MWETKEFSTREEMEEFIDEYGNDIQWEEVFIDNAYGIDYRPLKKIH